MTYEETFTHPKSSDTALIIPVINEGDRILQQLKKIQDVNQEHLVDVILVDGGSDDGSTAPELLKSLGVHTLLLKEHSEGQGVQLRIGFSHALKMNYDYFITIDGNNKDDPATLKTFIDRLKDGYDFVQGSRFLGEGNSVNTPWFRAWGIRLIHAPILSLATKRKWTDTTQNYRAYSKRLLCDDRAQFFRDIFKGYELTPYFPYISTKLGFKVTEIPTKRSYPKNMVPTKIYGFKGNYYVFKVLIKTVLGHYNPKSTD